VQALKAAVSAGRLGAPRRLRACVVWPRDAAYYARNRWAGRIRDDAGRLVLDSPVNNAAAHYLHNMLFVIGGEADRSAKPLSVEAELYRANPIENFDAACMRIATDIGAEVDFVAVHCADVSFGPASVFEFEEATVTFEGAGSTFHAVFRDGREEDFGSPDAGGHTGKLWSCLAAARAGRFEDRPPCGIETATPHATVVSGLAEIPVADLPRPLLRSAPLAPGAAPTTWCEGMADAAREAYRHGALFSERGTPWAATPRVVRFAG
jgi:predicted dehydrogenase